jgi:Flp pilus assembly protein TadD
MQFFTQEVKRNPSDLAAKNNLAVTALLLNAQEFKPNDLAREVYQNAPTNSSFASTYAFSLYLQGKNSEALKVIEKLKPNELQDPSNSGYYGIILKAAGNQAQARACLERALKGHLLPEEKKLFEAANVGG